MLKRLVLIVVALLLIPALASAANMQVTASAIPTLGGSISPTSITQWPGPLPAVYSITVNPGYTISSVTIDSVSQPISTTYTIPYVSGTIHTIIVRFVQATYSITTSAGPGGQIQITGGAPTSIPFGSNRTVIVSPLTGYSIISYIVDGGTPVVPADPLVAVSIPFNNIQANHTVSATFAFRAAVTSSAGADQTLTANSSGAASTTLTGSATTNNGPLTYQWNVASKPSGASATFGNPNSATTPFNVTGIGTYKVTLTATSGGTSVTSAPATITVLTASQSASITCYGNSGCHIAQTTLWITSPHANSLKTTAASCPSCHNPGLALPHPGYDNHNTVANPGLYYSCVTCHYPGSTLVGSWPPPGLSFHNSYNGTNQCVLCHNPHTTLFNGNVTYPHFTNSTTAAQYVNNPNVTCDKCHTSVDGQGNSSFNIFPANSEWAQTGKANPASPSWMTYQFKSMGTPAPATPATSTANDCVRCHTTTGYINYVDSDFTNIAPFGPALGSREMVACSACHYSPFNSTIDPETGTAFNRRVIGVDTYGDGSSYNVYGYYGYSSAQSGKKIWRRVFDDSGDSNLCVACHSGRAAGSNITDVATKLGATSTFWQNVTFINPHYMGSAGILFQTPPNNSTGFKIGYEYRSFNFYNNPDNFAHPALGDSLQGPCVSCHMAGSVQKHRFSPVSSSQGVIKAITSTTCFAAYCHDNAGFDASYLQSLKEGYQASMTVIAAQLGEKGIYFNPAVYPYFFTTSDPVQQNFGTRTLNWTRTINNPSGTPVLYGSAVMGAAFNLKLLQTDAGSWTHNDVYTKRLLYDTIDFLDDGVQNNSVSATITNMSTINPVTKTKAQTYISPRP